MSKLHSVNAEQGLYVIHEAGGYSTWGFEVLDRKARAVAGWCHAPLPTAALGTAEHYEQCQTIMQAGAERAERNRDRCPADLTPQLIGLEGRRVEVVDAHGERRRFKVGKSTGWLPCHLELHNARSMGGGPVYGAPFKSVVVIK